ncbi:MAG: hypothetical protein J1G07_00430 [Clostridiales bacterium]|nr:hypothetical protein [Clostridiales bacterium]
MKRLKKKGEPFEELSVVKSAGFEKGKRRDKSINKKAGLHGKTVSQDQTRVYRCKPLAVKHKRRLRKVLPALLALISVAMVIIITGSYMPPVNFDDLEGDYRTVYLEVPQDSSSPENHTVVETIGYLNYTLQNQPYWSSEMEQSLSAMFNIKQSTYNYKKYYNNTLISVDIAKGASTSAKQFCQTDKVVLWRDAVDVNSTNGFYTNWKTGQPAGLTVSEFRKKRGLPPAEFSVYVLNENTILNAQENGVVNNGDGTYSVTVNLNVNTKGGEENDMRSAVYYYKQQMAVTGGLSQLPTYEYTNVTYVFDANYRVLSFEIRDKYEATLRITGLGEVTSGCTSTTKTVFSYEMEDCINSVYDDFKPYLNDFGEGDDKEPEFSVSATNCLAGAFASVLSEGAVFKLDLGLGGKTVEGVVGVALKDGGLDNLVLKLGNITAHVLNGQDGYVVYLALDSNKYKVSLGELDLSAAMGNIELPATDGEGEGDLLSGLLDSLLGGDFAYDSQKGLATLDSDISLFGININISFAFSVDEEKEEISLIDVKANIKYGKIDVDATLKFGDESDKPAELTAADKVLYKDILNDGVAVGVDLTLGEKAIKGVAKVDLLNGEFVGLRAKLGEITVHYDGANLYISSGDSKYKLGLDSLGGTAELSAGVEFDINSLLSDILENLSIENGIIKVQVLGLDISIDLFGGIKVSAYYDAFGGIGVDAYLSNDTVPAQLTEQDKAAYTDILNDGVTVGVDLTLGEKVIKGVAKVDLLNGEFAGLRAKLGEITVHYDGANLYISSGDSKYKLGLDSLGGSAELPAGVEFDINSLLSGILENLTIEDGIIKVQVLGLDISVDLFGGIKVSAYYDLFGGIGVDAYLSNDTVPAQLTEQDKAASYTDILNDGVTVGVDITLGESVIKGVAKVDLLNGEFAGLRAKLGEITVHYDGASLYISSGDSKYKLGLDSLGGSAELSAGVEFDINSLLSDILENLTIENGIIKVQIYGLDISVDLFGGIKVSAYYDAFGGIGVDAYLSNDSVPAQLTEQDKATYTDILNDGVTVGVSLTIDGKFINGVAKIDLSNGEFVGLRAKLGDAIVHYEDDILYISVSGSKIKLPLSAFGGATVNTDGSNLNGLIKDILNGVHIENGIINTVLFGADVSLDIFGGIRADILYKIFNAKIKASVTLLSGGAPASLNAGEKNGYVDVTQGFSLSGMLGVTLGGEQISLAVNNLAVSFENSFSFKLDTTLLLNNTYNNFYIEYLNGVLTVTYGAVSPMPMSMDGAEVVYDVISVRLDLLGGDLEVLEKEIVNVYNRIVAVYNEIAKQNVQAAGELQDILDMLGIAQDGVNGMSEIFEKLALPVKDGKLDMQTLLKTIAISSTQNGISVTLGNIFAEFALKSSGVNCGANIRFGTSSFDLTISDVIVDKYCDFEVPCESPLDRYGFTELLDYLGATAEMLLQHNISLDLSGTIYDYDASYSEYGNIKYIFNALLEYDDGGSMPVTFKDGQLYVSNDLYLHAKLDLVAQNTKADDSLYLDVYILDGYPGGTDSNGFTTGGYTPDGTGLDFYVSVSKLAEGVPGYNPLKFYGSMNEVLSIASMGVAMLNLQDINTTNDKVNETVASIYELLNGMLIENYIPSVKSQFASLGESLIPNILGTDLSTLLNKIIAEYERVMDGVEHKTEITEGNFIKKATYADGRLDVALNSATLFGEPEYEDLTFYITKTEGERSLISGLGINNIYFGDNGVNKLNLAAGITYNPVSKPDSATAFKNYHNFEGLDKLLLTAVNSATHETTAEEEAEGYLADYKLNNDYCVDGNITLKILGKEIPIKINTLHINIDENNEVSFDINLSHDRATFLGMELLTDSATVDISIKKDMVYVKKAIEGGATSYRIMPSNVFMNDMFNQLSYILSFGDTINNLADQFMSGSSEKVMPEFKDYGDYISKFVNVYTYSQSENSSEWTITANGNTLGGLAGMSGLKDIEVKFKGENGVLNTLTLTGGLSIITFSGTLNYINPNEKFVDGKSDLSNNVANLVADGLYYTWTEILGGDTLGKISEHLMWEQVADIETSYLSYDGIELTLGGYKYIGASYLVDNDYAIGSFADLKECGIDLANTQPIWMKADIGMSAKRDIAGWKKYKYTIVANSINIDFIGNAEVIDKISISGIAFGYANDSETYEPNSSRSSDVTLQFTGGNGSFSHAGISFGAFTTDYKSYGQVAVNLSLDCNGYRLDTWAHSFAKLPLI